MERIEKAIEVNCPIRAVYNQWTQFEQFPKFMSGVSDVRQLDDTHVHWRAELFGKEKEWDAEITEQVPDRIIAWRSTSGDAPNAGTVWFEPVSSDRTRIRLAMEYEPQGALENVGDALGLMSRRVESTVKDFKEFIESRGSEEGAWRGEVHGGQTRSGDGSPGSSSSLDSSLSGSRSSGGSTLSGSNASVDESSLRGVGGAQSDSPSRGGSRGRSPRKP